MVSAGNSPVAVDLDVNNHVFLGRTRACEEEDCEEETYRRSTTAGPASQERRGSYLKMARNDENLSTG